MLKYTKPFPRLYNVNKEDRHVFLVRLASLCLLFPPKTHDGISVLESSGAFDEKAEGT